MMNLSQAFHLTQSTQELNDLFSKKKVGVAIYPLSDEVTVEGYRGSITTDEIAEVIFDRYSGRDKIDADSERLGFLLIEKVFKPLHRLVEAPENKYCLYQLFALTRVVWKKTLHLNQLDFGGRTALKHATVVTFLYPTFDAAWI